jgi:CRISPR-associated endonuclease/helicase Cas3
MSVNISADYMISDLCPIDRLVQRVGRLSRFGQVAGCLRVVVPQKDGAWYPTPYASRKKKEWVPQPAMLSTYEKLRVAEYTGQDFVDLVNEVYPFVPVPSIETQQNMSEYAKQILQNWLIVPAYTDEVDEQETTRSCAWRSRDIDTQFKVFVVHPLAYLGQEVERERAFFERYLDFRFYENEAAIDCPHYVFHKAVKEGKIHQLMVEVGDEERKIFWVDRDYYTEELGLYFDAETETNFI